MEESAESSDTRKSSLASSVNGVTIAIKEVHRERNTDAEEPPGILQEVGISIIMIISGCNSAKKLIFFKIKIATLYLKISAHLIL